MIQRTERGDSAPQPPPVWLLLVHQLPARPSNVRVKTWRRLQKLGALAVKNSVYVLPNSPQAREDFEWMKAEIAGMKGQATVFAADSVDSVSCDELVAGFRNARQRDYQALRENGERWLSRKSRRTLKGSERVRLERDARLARERLAEVEAIDFFQADGREDAAASVQELERLLEGGKPVASPFTGERLHIQDFQNRLWATRPGPGIDRMACAWLIRRFIDPRARFGFVHKPDETPGTVPFDMFGVEFSHQGNACSFETLARRFGIADAAVEWLGRLVHELDLKDEKYVVPEAAAMARLVEGLRRMYSDDHELLERGIVLFEALYRSFAGDSAAQRAAARPRLQRKSNARRAARR